jgi:hypothetical protein
MKLKQVSLSSKEIFQAKQRIGQDMNITLTKIKCNLSKIRIVQDRQHRIGQKADISELQIASTDNAERVVAY